MALALPRSSHAPSLLRLLGRDAAERSGLVAVLKAGAAALCALVVGYAFAAGPFLGGGCLAVMLVAGILDWLRRRVRDEEDRFAAVAECISDGICLVDMASGYVLEANPAFRRLVDRSIDELRETRLDDLVAGDPIERMLLRRDGTAVRVVWRTRYLYHDGRDVICVVVTDDGVRQRYEESADRARAQADALARSRSTLLTNVSHEFRTPLCSILGWATILRDEAEGAQREIAEHILVGGERLQWTLDSVLELAQLETDTRRLNPVTLDVVDELGYVLDPWKRRAERNQVAFHFRHPASLQARIDPTSLHRIVGNLVDNAVKFTREGEVAVTLSVRGGELCIQVDDTGAGIDQAFVPHLFDEFKQESEGLAREHEGMGLGLAITRRLVDLHGGRIAVDSTKGKGTRFTVRLPDVVRSRSGSGRASGAVAGPWSLPER